jgi:hypothetical protein
VTIRDLTTYVPQAVSREWVGSLRVLTSIFPALGYAETLVVDATGDDIDGDRCEPTQAAAEAMHARFVRDVREGSAS